MPQTNLTPQQLDKLRQLAARWGKIVCRQAFGDNGPGLDMDFFSLEQVAAAAAQGLTEGTLAALLEQQVQALPAEIPCPDCGLLCPVKRETRALVCRGSTLTYPEPLCHCPACRRDFFPSTAGPGPG